MKRLTFVFLALAAVCFSTSCEDNNRIVGSANITTQNRDLIDFTQIDASSVIDVTVTQGAEFSVVVRANDNIIDQVITNQRGSVLELDLQGANFRNVTVEVDVIMPDLTGLTLDAAGDGEIRGFANLSDLRLEVTGAGDLEVFSSEVDVLEAIVSGAGDVDAFGLSAGEAIMKVTGAGDVELTVTDRLAGDVSGAGNLRYRGNPELAINVTGAGDLINAN